MGNWKISFDTMDVAASTTHDCGVWYMYATDEDVKEKAESLVRLGFTPEVSQVTDE